MTTLRLATGFNEFVQWDVLYLDNIMVSHLIDEATRWTVASVLPDKRPKQKPDGSNHGALAKTIWSYAGSRC
eukprot:12938573-Prorocentrum_lima.AAC.1